MTEPTGLTTLIVVGVLLVTVANAALRRMPSWLLRILRRLVLFALGGAILAWCASAPALTQGIVVTIWLVVGGISRYARNHEERQHLRAQRLQQAQQSRRRVPPPPPSPSTRSTGP